MKAKAIDWFNYTKCLYIIAKYVETVIYCLGSRIFDSALEKQKVVDTIDWKTAHFWRICKYRGKDVQFNTKIINLLKVKSDVYENVQTQAKRIKVLQFGLQ